MVRQFHDGMKARVQNDGEYSEPFTVTNVVKRGCVMAPILFSVMFSAMPKDAMMLVSLSSTALVASYSTLEGCKPNIWCRQMY